MVGITTSVGGVICYVRSVCSVPPYLNDIGRQRDIIELAVLPFAGGVLLFSPWTPRLFTHYADT